MTSVFYILWCLSIIKVLLGPTLRLASKVLAALLIAIGVWIIVGTTIYQRQYEDYVVKKAEYEKKAESTTLIRKKIENLAHDHPTSRDVLIHLAHISFQLGEHEKVLEYVDQLKKIDPNNDQVQNLFHAIN